MPNTVTIGVVKLVASTTTGTIEDLAGNTITYSDATLPTRFIDLKLGEYVIFGFDTPTTTNITPLTAIYAKGLTDANAANSLTAASIKRQLQINNCCAAKKGAEYIEKFDQDIPCDNLKKDAELMVDFIDSIAGFVPENEYVSGKQATYMISVTATSGIPVVSLTIGTAVYSFNSVSSSNSDFAADIAAKINDEYPQNFPYYAEASGANVIISGSTFATANAVAVSGSTTNGTLTFIAPNALAGGVAGVLQGANGITNEQVQRILNKINSLCAIPCEDVVNLSNRTAGELDGVDYMQIEGNGINAPINRVF